MGRGFGPLFPIKIFHFMKLLFRLTQFFLFILPFQIAISPFSGIDLPFSRIFSPLLFLLFLVVSFSRRRIWISPSRESLFLYSFLFFSVLSVLWSENVSWAIRRSTFLLTFLPLFPVYLILLKEVPNAPIRLSRALVIGAGLSGFLGILEFLSQYIFGAAEVFRFWTEAILPLFLGKSFAASVSAYPSLLVNISGLTMLRVSSFFPDPHMAAFYMGLTLPLGIFLFLDEKSSQRKIFWGILSIFILSADLLTFSRGGYFGLLFGTCVMFLWSIAFKKEARKNLSFFLGAAFFLSLSVLIVVSPIGERFISAFSSGEGSNMGRIEMYREAIRNITRQPWGYGLGNYPLAVKPTAEFREPIYAHDLFLDIATESGVFGAVFFLLAFVSVFMKLIRFRRGIFFAGAVSLAIFFGHALFEMPFYSVHILPVLLFFFALPSGILSDRRDEK